MFKFRRLLPIVCLILCGITITRADGVGLHSDLGEITSARWSPDGNRIATGHWSDSIGIWDARTGELVNHLPVVISQVPEISFVSVGSWSSDSTKLTFVASNDAGAYGTGILDSADGQLTYLVLNESGAMFHGAADQLLSISSEGTIPDIKDTIRIRNTRYQEILSTIRVGAELESLSLKPDGSQLVTVTDTGFNSEVTIWDTANGLPMRHLQGHTDRVLSVDWSPDGNAIATGSMDRTVRIWDADGNLLLTIPIERFGDAVSWSPDGTKLAVQMNPFVQIFDPNTGEAVSEKFISERTVSWSPDSTRIVVIRENLDTFAVFDTAGNVVLTSQSFTPTEP